jgi:hypothetical protein
MPVHTMSFVVMFAAVLLLLVAAESEALPAYCGAPPVDVAAAAAPPGMELRFLIVTTRHGDRTPVGLYPGSGVNSNDVEWRCNLTQLSAIETGDEAFVQPGRLYRKRYLNQREVLPGNCMFGQLTAKGREQHIALGKSLRNVYVDKYGFLNPQFADSELWLRSTDVPRTIASAQSLLAGMYPPSSTGGAGVPVFDLHSIDAWRDNMTPNEKLCPHLRQIYTNLMQTEPWIAHMHEIAPLDAKLRAIFNVPPNATIDIIDVFDETYARICHGKPLPGAVAPLEQLIALNAQFEMAYFYNRTRTALTLNIGSFVAEQLERLEQARNGSAGGLKWILYSGHDTTLWPLSFAYGFGSIEYWPPYASHMEIELWQSARTGEHFVRFLFNGRPRPAPGCASSEPCSWATFRAAIDNVLPHNFGQQCAQEVSTTATARDVSSLLRLR